VKFLHAVFLLVALNSLAAKAAEPESSAAEKITFTSFNIRWFGLGGEFSGLPSDEYRSKWLKEFITNNLATSDVIVFEEIVDVTSLANDVLGQGWACVTYHHPEPRHQHVVLCHKDRFEFVKESDDDNFAIESIAIDPVKSRPGLSGVLKLKDGRPLAHVVGLHLKADPEHSATRMGQAEQLSSRLKQFSDGLPVVVLGDYNTHPAALTGAAKDDEMLIDEVFAKNEAGLTHVPNPFEFTYHLPEHGAKLDHIWVSSSLLRDSKIDVFSVCNSEAKEGVRFTDLMFYNRFVSDHCPITTTLGL